MDFNEHYKIKGQHAFLSASNYHWTNYTDERLVNRYYNHLEAARGTALHAYADMAIRLGLKQPRNTKTLNMFINDAIGFRMTPEQVLFYSHNAFGTADAISFHKRFLRIHDLKNGVVKASMQQLRVYMAFFCLEYEEDPHDFKAELRIYQNDDIEVETPDPDEISEIMATTVHFDTMVEEMRKEIL